MVEVTLFRGAEYNNGWTPAPTVDPKGFELNEDMSTEAGYQFTGYVRKMEVDRITLTMGRNPGGRSISADNGNNILYFKEETIHSCRLL
ncbi:MAG TPA: hypothetical protein VJA18_07340 [Candidatus Nanoarchaeia archaeon]|nr:hypothetical protein [Candidatus Nanoarchaeia archaeon]